MSGFVDLKEAVERAKDLVSTVVVTLIFRNLEPLTLVVEVQGINEMVFIVKELDRLKEKRKIKSYTINNISSFPSIDVATFKKMLAESV